MILGILMRHKQISDQFKEIEQVQLQEEHVIIPQALALRNSQGSPRRSGAAHTVQEIEKQFRSVG